MEKNDFLMINDLIYDLYATDNLEDLKDNFLMKLKLLIPYSYASILLRDEHAKENIFSTSSILCIPDFFEEAESQYIKFAGTEDQLLWILHSKESQLIRESDLLNQEQRLNSALYQHCYRKFNIYDSLQYTIVYQQKFLGALTLFRTKIDGPFSDFDLFYLRSLGIHLNAVLNRLMNPDPKTANCKQDFKNLQKLYHLTNRECQILEQIFQYKNNIEICSELHIQENTLQKHMQNIFRKTKVTSKWDLLRL